MLFDVYVLILGRRGNISFRLFDHFDGETVHGGDVVFCYKSVIQGSVMNRKRGIKLRVN